MVEMVLASSTYTLLLNEHGRAPYEEMFESEPFHQRTCFCEQAHILHNPNL